MKRVKFVHIKIYFRNYISTDITGKNVIAHVYDLPQSSNSVMNYVNVHV